jgi:hypothetical protein
MRALTLLVATVAALLLPAPATAGATATGYRYPPSTQRVAEADPYVDAIGPGNEIQVDDAANLFGPPDGRNATVNGRQFRFLVLDLGAGEEGVGDLEVRYALKRYGELAVSMDVHFLDRNGQRLGQGQLTMFGFDGLPRTTTVTNPSATPYRYLKILTGLHTVYFDSMRAAALAP